MSLQPWENGLDQFINLPHGGPGAGFRVSALIAHIQSSGRDYVQGQQNCILDEHTKPNSLDAWLRQNCTERPGTRQAVTRVAQALVASGRFESVRMPCPDSGRRCKGLRLVNAP